MPQSLTVSDVLYLAVISGALGGLVYVCTKINIRRNLVMFDGEPAFIWPLVAMFSASIVLGAASAVCLLFLFYFLQLLKADSTVQNEVFIISSSLIAGIAAQRLIPRYTRSLESKLDAIDRATEETREVAEETNIITKAQGALNANAPLTQRLEAVELLKGLLVRSPLDRTATIYLGRLYRRLDRLGDAISTLEEFITKKEQVQQLDKNYADVHYNRACYYAQIWAHEQDEKSKKNALESLGRAIQYSPENKKDAAADEDFESLRKTEEFQKLIG
jgi:tetratricopeptide (TPR) repeat protein